MALRRVPDLSPLEEETASQARFSWQSPLTEDQRAQLSQTNPVTSPRHPMHNQKASREERHASSRAPQQPTQPHFEPSPLPNNGDTDMLGNPLTPIDMSPISPLDSRRSLQRFGSVATTSTTRTSAYVPLVADKTIEAGSPYASMPPPREMHPAMIPLPMSPPPTQAPQQSLPPLPHQRSFSQHSLSATPSYPQFPDPQAPSTPQLAHQRSFSQESLASLHNLPQYPPPQSHSPAPVVYPQQPQQYVPQQPLSPPPKKASFSDEPPLASPRFMRSDREEQDVKSPIQSNSRNSTPKLPSQPYMPHSSTPSLPRTATMIAPDTAILPSGAFAFSPIDVHQPGQIVHPNMSHKKSEDEKQDWQHALCGCGSDIGTCLTGLFCPCVLYGKTNYRLSQRSARKDPTDLLGWKWANTQCGIMGVACGFGLGCLFPMLQRTRIRHAYHLQGSICGDIVRGCCCCCCSVIQNEREVRDREESMRKWAGPGSGESLAYPKEQRMTYAPPPRG